MVDRELQRDQHRGGQRGDLRQRPAAGDEGDHHGEHRRGGEHRVLDPLDPVDLAPDAERRAAVELALDGALVERGEAGVDRPGSASIRAVDRGEGQRRSMRLGFSHERSVGRSASGRRSPEQPVVAGQVQRREGERGELRGHREGEQRPAGERAGEEGQRPREQRRDQRVVGVRLQGEVGVRVGEPGEGDHDAELAPAAARAQPHPAERRGRRTVARSKAIAAACEAGSSSQLPLHGSASSNGT